ncbi:KAT8 regulatory NSL complex subunit 1-like protein isoform X2 [Hypomesus transpacificus]|uniref:KAT8 regulatory NSL complex subunit 1-like protein isoform X2 n=1 Tax=Hypomesus transpacificus TaxID=137520 RepID=UPI001F072D2F|nr:KAT8 regulatory NSL complex subunit 1-like protein isoform X2 [Hypomesus transpacificus]
MAPALTKLTKDRHRIHLPSPLSSSNMEADGAMLSPELDPHVKLMEDNFSQKVWLNLSSLPFLDTCCSKGSLDFPNSILAPLLQASSSQYKSVLLSRSLLSLISLNKNLKDSQAAALTGMQDMYIVPIPEQSGQDVVMQPQHCGADGPDVPQSPPHYQGNTMCQYSSALPTPTMSREGKRGVVSTEPASAQAWATRAPDQPVTAAVVQGAVRDQTQWHVTRQAALLLRAERIQRRLQALLGDHTSRHCSIQLDALKNRLREERTGTLPAPVDTKPDPLLVHVQIPGPGSRVQWPLVPESCSPPSTSTEMLEFACRAQALLRGVQQAIDSDATDSGSDDEGLEPERPIRNLAVPFRSGCEQSWQEGRAEVGSRWTWLQLRVDELEGRIQQLGDLHRQISSTKGGVVLADSQPLTDRQIQQTLLTETAGLSFTAGGHGDLASDTEPSSPTRLLRNIERQSAQLTQIVTSLMPPLNLSPSSSPVSKDACRWNGLNKKAFGSCLKKGEDAFLQRGAKRRRGARRRQLLQADASCVSARTRHLVTYHKPRLFTLNGTSAHTQQELGSASFSSSPSSSCPTCESCDPLGLCSDPACSSYAPPPGRGHSRAHPVLSLSSDTPLQQHLQRALLREDWLQRPLLLKTEPPSPVPHPCPRGRRLSSTPLPGSSQRHKHHGRHRGGGVRGVSPVGWAGRSQMPRRKAYQGSRKRRNSHRVLEDEDDLLCWLSDPEDGSGEGLEEMSTPQTSHARKPPVQGPIRRRQGESVYNIDNIVIPMSLAATTKVEKLQYKDIITPSWRIVGTLLREVSEGEKEEEEEEEEEEVELLCDEIFSQRHLGCEQREKLRWVSWGKSRLHRRTTRSGSRSLDGSMGTGGSAWDCGLQCDGTPPPDWGCTYPETDAEEGAGEECVPQAPWEQRVFPLGREEVEALHWDQEDPAETGPPWDQAGEDSSSAEDSSSLLSNPFPSTPPRTTPPSVGHLGNSAPEEEG